MTPSEQLGYQLDIQKSQSALPLFDLKRASSELDNTEIMLDLIRQEDERDEKPVKNLKHRMRLITHSSRNLLNEKYFTLMRKLGERGDTKSRFLNPSRSLSNLLSGKSRDTESGSSSRSSILEVCKPIFKAKAKTVTPNVVKRTSFKKTNHPMVRSVSDDSSMKGRKKKSVAPKVAAITEYQDSTRSSPNICAEDEHLQMADVDGSCFDDENVDIGIVDHSFGKFSSHQPHLLHSYTGNTLPSCSSNTVSIAESESSSSEEDDNSEINEEEHEQLEDLNETSDKKIDESWINIKQLSAIEKSLPNLQEDNQLLRDEKELPHSLQVHRNKFSRNRKLGMQ